MCASSAPLQFREQRQWQKKRLCVRVCQSSEIPLLSTNQQRRSESPSRSRSENHFARWSSNVGRQKSTHTTQRQQQTLTDLEEHTPPLRARTARQPWTKRRDAGAQAKASPQRAASRTRPARSTVTTNALYPRRTTTGAMHENQKRPCDVKQEQNNVQTKKQTNKRSIRPTGKNTPTIANRRPATPFA